MTFNHLYNFIALRGHRCNSLFLPLRQIIHKISMKIQCIFVCKWSRCIETHIFDAHSWVVLKRLFLLVHSKISMTIRISYTYFKNTNWNWLYRKTDFLTKKFEKYCSRFDTVFSRPFHSVSTWSEIHKYKKIYIPADKTKGSSNLFKYVFQYCEVSL